MAGDEMSAEKAAWRDLANVREAILNLRIEVAQRRDDLLTPDEQIALIEVWQKYGR